MIENMINNHNKSDNNNHYCYYTIKKPFVKPLSEKTVTKGNFYRFIQPKMEIIASKT